MNTLHYGAEQLRNIHEGPVPVDVTLRHVLDELSYTAAVAAADGDSTASVDLLLPENCVAEVVDTLTSLDGFTRIEIYANDASVGVELNWTDRQKMEGVGTITDTLEALRNAVDTLREELTVKEQRDRRIIPEVTRFIEELDRHRYDNELLYEFTPGGDDEDEEDILAFCYTTISMNTHPFTIMACICEDDGSGVIDLHW